VSALRYLVEPRGVDRDVDQAQVLVGAVEPVDRGPSGVRGAVVDDPEHALGRCVGLFVHHLLDQPPEGLDPGLLLDTVEWFVVRSVKAVARAARIELTRDLP
jgi:hypothetical protein